MPEKQPEKKPFYNVNVGKKYDYKKNNEGIAKLADSNKKMGQMQLDKNAKRAADYKKAVAMSQKPKPKSKADIKAAVVAKAPPKAAKPGISMSGRSYTAVKGDSLYGIAEKTLPPGKDLGRWFAAIKQMNAGRKLFRGTGVALPAKAKPLKSKNTYR